MRAVVLREGRLEVRETADPVPGPGHLLLRVVSTAICASDVHFMDHHDAIPAATNIGMVYDENRDIVLGHEFVGEVIGHGSDCSDQFPVGTRVTSMPILLADGAIRVIGQNPAAQGSFGELLVVSEAMARAVPDGVSPDAAALVDAFAVGEYYVRSSGIGSGEYPDRHRRGRHRAQRGGRPRCTRHRAHHRVRLQGRASRAGYPVRARASWSTRPSALRSRSGVSSPTSAP